MSALEVTRCQRAFGSDFGCAICRAEKRQYSSPATRQFWVLGRPLMRTCRRHENVVRAMWEGALNG